MPVNRATKILNYFETAPLPEAELLLTFVRGALAKRREDPPKRKYTKRVKKEPKVDVE